MSLLESIREKYERATDIVAGAAIGMNVGHETIMEMQKLADDVAKKTKESQSDLQLAMDDVGWVQLNEMDSKNIPHSKVMDAVKLSRLMYLLNPLIKRAVTVQELYVWGSGCTIRADAKEVQEVVDAFFNDPKNQCAIGQAWEEREREQRNDGNVFFFLFRSKSTGACRVRTVPIEEIVDIVSNPEDKNETWYYKRRTPDGKFKLYPDILYTKEPLPASYKIDNESFAIAKDAVVLHSKSGGIPGMKFGMPEFYSVFNWAVAYKGILENFATILKAYARIAWKLSGQAGKDGVAASKSKLQTKMSSSTVVDKNPPTNTAGYMILAGNADLSAVKTANSTTAPDEARALRSMVAAGTDTPEHFFGDSEVGNFATSETLDRPTELKMIARQTFWAHVMQIMIGRLIEWSALAPDGVLNKAGYKAESSKDPFDGTRVIKVTPKKDASLNVEVKFPVIVERAVTDRVRAAVMAITLNGSPAEGIIPDRKEACRMLLEAMGIKNVDKLLDVMYPEPVLQGFVDPKEEMGLRQEEVKAKTLTADASMKSASQPKPAAKPAPKK